MSCFLTTLYTHDSVASFLSKTKEFLSKFDAEHNLIIGVCDNFIKSGNTNMILLCHVENFSREVVACLMWSESRFGTIISNIEVEYRQVSLELFVDAVLKAEKLEMNCFCATVSSRSFEANKFASIYCSKRNLTYDIKMNQGIYKLETVKSPTCAGTFRHANEEDINLVARWLVDFGITVGLKHSELSARELASKKTSGNFLDRVWFWLNEENVPVSMAAIGRYTDIAAVIGHVYTPEEYRGNGYASAITATLSKKALESGKSFCYLYTDLSNPISNNIYKKIGYNYIGEQLLLKFNHS